jgi:hypothetical protein
MAIAMTGRLRTVRAASAVAMTCHPVDVARAKIGALNKTPRYMKMP